MERCIRRRGVRNSKISRTNTHKASEEVELILKLMGKSLEEFVARKKDNIIFNSINIHFLYVFYQGVEDNGSTILLVLSFYTFINSIRLFTSGY